MSERERERERERLKLDMFEYGIMIGNSDVLVCKTVTVIESSDCTE